MVKLTNSTQIVLDRPLTQDEASWIVSVLFLSGGLGFILSSYLVDSIGSKYCVIFSGVTRLVSALLFIFAREVWMLLLGRCINGLSEGLLVAAVPVYSSEIASKEIRGALGTMLQIFASIGSVIMLSVGPFVSYFYLNLMYIILIVFISIPTVFLPDSPQFLYSKGKHEESRKVLIYLRGSEFLADEELKLLSANNNVKLNLISTFTNKTFLSSIMIAAFVVVSIHFSGFNCVLTYLQTILNLTHTNLKSEMGSVVIGVIQVTAAFSTMLITDKFGRKPILVVSAGGMALGMIGLGTFFKLQESEVEITGFLNFLPLISLIIVVYCYSAGLGSLLWVLLAELFDDHSRGVGVSTALLIGVLPSFVTVRYFTAVTEAVGEPATFWFSSAVCLVLAAFILYQVPETKGRTFKEIQDALKGEGNS
ncbi:facilitated trehalose transporter Tret1-like [Choristoneura fumiferana]|uniref:facilitated trehalose transporter Tret1-like n=1 Tax=Choristoneura fumiferana TaxID=7141 RepID=UPI003D15E0C2